MNEAGMRSDLGFVPIQAVHLHGATANIVSQQRIIPPPLEKRKTHFTCIYSVPSHYVLLYTVFVRPSHCLAVSLLGHVWMADIRPQRRFDSQKVAHVCQVSYREHRQQLLVLHHIII